MSDEKEKIAARTLGTPPTEEWLRRCADAEDGKCVSVGGLHFGRGESRKILDEKTLDPNVWRTITTEELQSCDGRHLEILLSASMGHELRFLDGEWVYPYRGVLMPCPRFLQSDYSKAIQIASEKYGYELTPEDCLRTLILKHQQNARG